MLLSPVSINTEPLSPFFPFPVITKKLPLATPLPDSILILPPVLDKAFPPLMSIPPDDPEYVSPVESIIPPERLSVAGPVLILTSPLLSKPSPEDNKISPLDPNAPTSPEPICKKPLKPDLLFPPCIITLPPVDKMLFPPINIKSPPN